jgi:hypothetical protein
LFDVFTQTCPGWAAAAADGDALDAADDVAAGLPLVDGVAVLPVDEVVAALPVGAEAGAVELLELETGCTPPCPLHAPRVDFAVNDVPSLHVPVTMVGEVDEDDEVDGDEEVDVLCAFTKVAAPNVSVTAVVAMRQSFRMMILLRCLYPVHWLVVWPDRQREEEVSPRAA